MMKRRHAALLGGKDIARLPLVSKSQIKDWVCQKGALWPLTCFMGRIMNRTLNSSAGRVFDCWSGTYALQPKHFAKLLGVDHRTCDVIFNSIFDTDANGLVDAFEAM